MKQHSLLEVTIADNWRNFLLKAINSTDESDDWQIVRLNPMELDDCDIIDIQIWLDHFAKNKWQIDVNLSFESEMSFVFRIEDRNIAMLFKLVWTP